MKSGDRANAKFSVSNEIADAKYRLVFYQPPASPFWSFDQTTFFQSMKMGPECGLGEARDCGASGELQLPDVDTRPQSAFQSLQNGSLGHDAPDAVRSRYLEVSYFSLSCII